MAVLPVVPVVHEQVHQRAGQQKQEWQRGEHMCRVLCHQIEAGDEQEPAQDDTAPGAPERRMGLVRVLDRFPIRGLAAVAWPGRAGKR